MRRRERNSEVTEGWCVKYALTQGIFKIYGHVEEDGSIMCPDRYFQNFWPKEWAADLDQAKVLAERRKEKRIVSLTKQLDKLRAMEIKVVDWEERKNA